MIINYVENFINEDSRQKDNIARFTCDFFENEEVQMNLAASNPAAMIMDGFNLKPIQSAVPTIKIENGKYKIIRRMYFNRIMDFFVTEFFEALSQGHYIWKCVVCNKYFLMTTAHKQLYCSMVNKEYGVPCSYVAKHPEITKRKMKKQKNPTVRIMFSGTIATVQYAEIKASVNTVKLYQLRLKRLLI